ncbi:MAG: chemotaxis protein CheB [Chloroflexi bacterium]|nr:chemotaxis protein CheB [Chloroflexota bacterium]
MMKILVAEDERATAVVIERTLQKAGYVVETVRDGREALQRLQDEPFDALVTDWMMPRMNGIDLIRRLRAGASQFPQPVIIMETALTSEESRILALHAGADDYIAKPLNAEEIVVKVAEGLARRNQPPPERLVLPPQTKSSKPPFVAVVIGASTGGPPTLIDLFRSMTKDQRAAYLIVQHGPSWMLSMFAKRLGDETPYDVHYVSNDTVITPGDVYVAGADLHMTVEPLSYVIKMVNTPKENFLRPAADPLFRTAAKAFSNHCVAVVLTGLGRDGTHGAAHVEASGGQVYVQDPKTAMAPSMPQTVISAGIGQSVGSISAIGQLIARKVSTLASSINGTGSLPRAG